MPVKGKKPVSTAKIKRAKSLQSIGRRFLPQSEQGVSDQ
jgi:hypothetical protein